MYKETNVFLLVDSDILSKPNEELDDAAREYMREVPVKKVINLPIKENIANILQKEFSRWEREFFWLNSLFNYYYILNDFM